MGPWLKRRSRAFAALLGAGSRENVSTGSLLARKSRSPQPGQRLHKLPVPEGDFAGRWDARQLLGKRSERESLNRVFVEPGQGEDRLAHLRGIVPPGAP